MTDVETRLYIEAVNTITDLRAELEAARQTQENLRLGSDAYILEIRDLTVELEAARIENKNLQGDVMDSDHNELVQLRAENARLRAIEAAARDLINRQSEGYATLVSYLIRLDEALA